MLRSLFKPFDTASSLTFSCEFLVSRVKSRKEKIKYYEANPHLFRRVSRMRPPDLTKKDLVFPITIPIRFTYRFRRTRRPDIPTHDFLNFKHMTGNEILLYMERCTELRPTEICGALTELAKRKGADKIDWSNHEFIVNCKEFVLPRLPNYRNMVIHHLVFSFYRLRIFDPLLWSALHKESDKMLHMVPAKAFGKLYRIYHDEPTRAPKEMLARMTEMMTNLISKMSPTDIVNCFEIVVKEKYLNYHLFEDIFYILFRNRNKWFGPELYVRIIRLFIQIKHLDDNDFWNKRFLPPILTMGDWLTEETMPKLAEALKEIREATNDKVNVDEYLKFFEERTAFLQGKLKLIESNRLLNIIMNDLKYYREKEIDRAERK